MHLGEELTSSLERIDVETRYGKVTGGRARNYAATFLEIPYALPPQRFADPVALPSEFRYETKEYIRESRYATQPTNDGQAAGVPWEDKVGLGEPSENPLFVNIVAPPSFPSKSKFPVRVYIHGGFLQFGSPHGLGSQAQYVAAERSEVWVNIGYRLSVFGYLASDEPKVEGNFGFKDQWLALEWVKANIEVFGGDPDDIQVTGLSAGAHSVHQLLHHASKLPSGTNAPFQSAVLQSNAIVASPKTPLELRDQFRAFCRALKLDPDAPDVLNVLRDPAQISWQTITNLIDSEQLGSYGTFRGCLDGTWLSADPDPMSWQRSGGLARGLQAHGVHSIILGDLSEEWYLYSIANPIEKPSDLVWNLERFYPADVVQKLLKCYVALPDDADAEQLQRRYGVIASDGQVHLPVRLLHRDLLRASYPVFRYTIEWTPEQVRPKGYVTHATDRPLWAFRVPTLDPSQVEIARAWLTAVHHETLKLEHDKKSERGVHEVLTLQKDKTIKWKRDDKWEDIMRLRKALSGEV
ncbi:carboxylesterase [Auriscalpium vulgare]|uniref:Carboxylesterase n=1 Tax=Auriscalpium vulgare TaxID=40419 RepID=A0ACB8SBW6_9AGAM|nr:carboxylesterase [Auriscalpium vulgare]